MDEKIGLTQVRGQGEDKAKLNGGTAMRVKAIKDLSQLAEDALFETVAEGLGHVLDNARRLCDDSEQLADCNRFQGSRVLRGIAEEEAAKFLILLDAVRCPRQPTARWSRQLARFNDHLAKGLYGRSYYWRPGTLGQLQEYLDREREDFYLDGPNDVDWIFRNYILQRREETLYVDFIVTEDGRSWLHPGRFNNETGLILKGHRPQALEISQALSRCGVATARGLEVVATVWRQVSMRLDLKWFDLRKLNHRTLEELESKGLLQEQPGEVYEKVIGRWQFPLYDLELTPIHVDRVVLRERQQNWIPDY